MGEPILDEVPHAFAVPADLEGTDTSIPITCPVFIGIVAVGTDGVGLTTTPIRVVEDSAVVMVHAGVTGKDVDTHREEGTPETSRCCPVTVAIVGAGDKGDVLADIEHVVVLVGEVAKIIAQDNGVGGLLPLSLIERGS